MPVSSQNKLGGHPAKLMGDEGGGLLISPDGVVPSVSVSACTIKSRRRYPLAPAHLGSPRKRAVKHLCVCVYQAKCGRLQQIMTSSSAIAEKPHDTRVTSIRKIAKWDF